MSRKRIIKKASSWFPDPLPALIRARKRAEEIARRTRTALVVAKGGKPVAVRPAARKRRRTA